MKRSLGIDFGSANTVLAWSDGDCRSIPSPRGLKRRLLESGSAADLDAATMFLQDIWLGLEVPESLVLTVPASRGQGYRNQLLEIRERVGMCGEKGFWLMDEPTAAAIHQGFSEEAHMDETWVVIDWGSATLDVSVIHRNLGSRDLHVAATAGCEGVGGDAMDEFLAEIWQVTPEIAEMRKQEECIDEALLETLLHPAFDLILETVGLHFIDRAFLTGGPVQMSQVRNIIARALDLKVEELLFTDPMTSVARGAAALAKMKCHGEVMVANRVSHSIGIALPGNGFHPLIERGDLRPATRQCQLTTSEDLQDIMCVDVLEGDLGNAQSRNRLGRYQIQLRPQPVGKVAVNLELALGEQGEMEVFLKSGDRMLGDALGDRALSSRALGMSQPAEEFVNATQVGPCDADQARVIYERIKLKYHPDRDPENREQANALIRELDKSYHAFLEALRKRVQAAILPALPWANSKALNELHVDAVLAQRLTRCLAKEMGTREQMVIMFRLLEKYPDYRRVVAATLSALGSSEILQKILAKNKRPRIGLAVLVENVSTLTLKERHEALKRVYQIPEPEVRERLRNYQLEALSAWAKS